MADIWQHFDASIAALHRRDELEQLILWAQGNDLAGPLRLYKPRYLDEEVRIAHYTLRWSRLMDVGHKRILETVSEVLGEKKP